MAFSTTSLIGSIRRLNARQCGQVAESASWPHMQLGKVICSRAASRSLTLASQDCCRRATRSAAEDLKGRSQQVRQRHRARGWFALWLLLVLRHDMHCGSGHPLHPAHIATFGSGSQEFDAVGAARGETASSNVFVVRVLAAWFRHASETSLLLLILRRIGLSELPKIARFGCCRHFLCFFVWAALCSVTHTGEGTGCGESCHESMRSMIVNR